MGARVNPVMPEKAKEFLDYLGNHYHERFSLLWRFGMETGLRISDILSFRGYHFRENMFEVIERKTSKRRVFSISPGLYDELRAFAEHYTGFSDSKYVFFSTYDDRERPLSRQHVHRVFRIAGTACGLKRIGAHSMRMSFAQNYMRETGDLLALQQIMNHKYISTTVGYLMQVGEGGKITL